MSRFVVRTVTGYPIRFPLRWGTAPSRPAGMSAHVCDSLYLYEVVRTFRSEVAAPIPGNKSKRLGVNGARAAAQRHAERLNRDTA